ncbi:MAG: hypothetical protein GY809_25445 [Planctomycetes bacterium]|nr:hypothetical protein [Planctomycetota bacterium]
MKTQHKICLPTVLVMIGLVLILEPEAFCVERSAAGRDQPVRGAGRNLWSFEKDKVDSVPQGWRVAETKAQGTTATWQVVKDDTAPKGSRVVAITANKNRGSTYNLLMAEKTRYGDVNIRVKVKAVAGKEDQGGGPIWRAKNANNYYIARWNPLENNFRVYFVKAGRRKQLGTANVKTDAKIWHEVRIVQKAAQITAYFDGKKLIELEDATFSEPGMVGLWVKADGRTAFDDFSTRPISGD